MLSSKRAKELSNAQGLYTLSGRFGGLWEFAYMAQEHTKAHN